MACGKDSIEANMLGVGADVICGLWFAASLIVVLLQYYNYLINLIRLSSVNDLFSSGFSALSLSTTLCIITFVFIVYDLIGPRPLVVVSIPGYIRGIHKLTISSKQGFSPTSIDSDYNVGLFKRKL